MTDYLWSKSEQSTESDQQIQQFMSGEDVVLDRQLLRFDIQATAVHAEGLRRIGILNQAETESINGALDELMREFESGDYQLGPPHEDSHSAIEFYLTQRLGDVGQKVHTGRSRNDQIQVAMRLYLRDRLKSLSGICVSLARAYLNRAEQDEMTPMPGYTHLQRAVPSSIGLWMGSFTEAFMDVAELTRHSRDWINTCPLGSAAGYGVNLPLDREFVSQQLGFDRVQLNPMYVQNSRGRFELQALSCLAQATMELRRFCWDLSLFASAEFGFVELPAEFVTGSSIMPNKSNPDFVELARAQHSVVLGAISEINSLLSLPSGYHRDLQLCKPPVLRAFGSSLLALSLCDDLIEGMTFNRQRMRDAIDPELYATDIAIGRVTDEGVPFRESYRRPLDAQQLEHCNPESSLRARVSPGSCGDLRLDWLRQRLESLSD